MVGKPDMILLVLVRQIGDQMTEVRLDLTEIKDRIGLLEAGYSLLSRRNDRIGADVSSIKTRLEGEA